MDNEKHGNGLAIVIAFFLGGLVGAVFSLLFAPLPGREAREKIRGASQDAKERTVGAAQRARQVTRERVTDLVDQGKTRIDEATGTMKAAVEAGKTAFFETKKEMTETLSDESNVEEAATDEKNVVS